MSANEELYRRIVKAVPEGIWVVSPEGRTIFCNERMAEILGTDVESLKRLSCFDPVFPDDIEEAQRQFGLQMAGEGQPFDFRLRRIDGSAIWVSISCMPMYDDGGVCTGLLGLFTDISGRRRAERDLREREERFRAIFSQAAVGIALASLTGDWLLVNDRLCQILGYTQAELRTKTFLDITHPDDRDASLGAIRQLLSAEISSWMTEKRYVRKYGNTVWGRLFVSLVRDQSNQPQYFVAVVEEVTDRIQAERALQESQQQLRLALSTGLGVWECDLHNNAVALSPQYRKAFGHPPISYDEWMKLIHPDDVERVRAVAQESVEEARGWEAEFRVLWPDGSVHWMLSKATVILDEGRQPERMVGVSLDVTERKQAEAALRESEERLRTSEARLMDAQRLAKVGSWERHIDADIIYWSDEISRILGVPNPPSNFPDFLKCVHPKDRERIVEADRTVRSSTAPVETEYRITRPDGEVRHVRSIVEAIRNDQGAPVRLAGATQDITERVKARELLRESEEHLKKAERLAQVGHWHWDLRANRVSGSEEMFRIFGKPENNIPTYEGFLQDLMPQDRERLERLIRDSLARKIGHSLEYQIAQPNGDPRTISCMWEVSLDEDGSPVRVFGTCQDITDSRRAQEEALARQKLESLGVLAGGIAHDFNNLLGGILAEAELAETDVATGLAPSEEIQRIKLVAIRGAEIVRELMIYAGQDRSVLVEAVDVSRLVEEILELLRVSISKHAVLRTDLSRNLPAVRGNAAQIRQVVMNLVINASEAIGEKEGIINATTALVRGSVNLASTGATGMPPGDYVRLEVSDNGCGMTETVKAKIFDPFFSTKFAGRGLGLAVVQGIVRAHGGEINLRSAPGEGTTFQVFLPCTPEMVAKVGGAVASAGVERSHARVATILIVEDEETLRLAVSKALRRRGFLVIEACNGSEAMHVLSTHKDQIDGVLLDVTLPGTSSREVFCKIQETRPELKVIVTSAYSKETVDAFFTGLRIDHFIRKPFQLGGLARLLGEVL